MFSSGYMKRKTGEINFSMCIKLSILKMLQFQHVISIKFSNEVFFLGTEFSKSDVYFTFRDLNSDPIFIGNI